MKKSKIMSTAQIVHGSGCNATASRRPTVGVSHRCRLVIPTARKASKGKQGKMPATFSRKSARFSEDVLACIGPLPRSSCGLLAACAVLHHSHSQLMQPSPPTPFDFGQVETPGRLTCRLSPLPPLIVVANWQERETSSRHEQEFLVDSSLIVVIRYCRIFSSSLSGPGLAVQSFLISQGFCAHPGSLGK